jgi:hypothetical protein
LEARPRPLLGGGPRRGGRRAPEAVGTLGGSG